MEDRRKDGANPWKQVRNRLKAYLQEEEEEDFLIYGSFNDAVSSQNTQSTMIGRLTNNEFERMQREKDML